ncbi:hypothetical protein N015_08555 [Pseudomonas asturiensis]|uniref:Uncharacterized protein n=1 Tax=Pseudomonas asturiensis TaxID=1190415 RepID=A0ABX6HA59_9PSED|nr:hypothetical protein [Pseudomonas asturiensis]QHF02457.1 hypothetical protein N015_08555 [Pseudomonas asturiensis]
MIDFKTAEHIARCGFDEFVSGASDISLEELVISDDNKTYEVTFSYDLQRTPLSVDPTRRKTPLFELATVLGKRREFKTFLVTADTGKLKGFKRYKGQ